VVASLFLSLCHPVLSVMTAVDDISDWDSTAAAATNDKDDGDDSGGATVLLLLLLFLLAGVQPTLDPYAEAFL